MFGQHGHKVFMVLMVLALLGPAALMFWNAQIGGLLFLVGLLVSYRCLDFLQEERVEAEFENSALLQARHNRARTIFVQLVDDNGNELDASTAQARLAAAHLDAGPRDTVVGVRHKVS
ncbi:MAG: hypothetical protein M3R24_33060 [Chloroflexota bacterium]|nr:hypothetical protein [Chloroflexota bacterium]